MLITLIVSQYSNLLSQPLQLPLNNVQLPTTWTIDFARRGSSQFLQTDSKGLVKEPYLVCGQSGHLKAFCPRSNSSFRPQRHIQAIEMEHSQHQDPRKRSRSTPSRDLDSAMKLIPPVTLKTDMMNTKDDDGLDSCKGDNSARGMGVRGTEVVLAPRGETGSFAQMPPTSLLYSHQPAKLNLSNSFNLDPNFSDPSILVSALSSPKKLLLPGTLRLGPLSHIDTFFVDCGADDLFMDSKLAADLQIPLLELSTPITLRLADGDSSSCLTHRTVPLQLHIGKHVETATFYVTDLCHGFILGYSWLERHNPRINWVSRMVDFDSPYCLENCCDGSSRIQGLGKPPNISKTFDLPLAPETISNPVDLSPIDCSLSDSISLGSMQSDVHPFAEVSPFSDVSVPSDILSSFSLLFSKDQTPILTHRPGTFNSQTNSFSCREDYKATSESSNFQRILPFIES
ncbi:hypothetical protein BASA83_013427 [Batrachochytrium salamandrivorans]|nr:hypothetical protein BASA83_013427 [Batrachochytrium salamandrivorans]